MAYVTVSVEVDADDILDELSDKQLEAELKRRQRKNQHDRILKGEALSTLSDVAAMMRKLNRFDLAYRVDEIKADYVE